MKFVIGPKLGNQKDVAGRSNGRPMAYDHYSVEDDGAIVPATAEAKLVPEGVTRREANEYADAMNHYQLASRPTRRPLLNGKPI